MAYYLAFAKENGIHDDHVMYHSTLIFCKNRKEAKIIRSTITGEKTENIRVLKMNIRTMDNMNERIENVVFNFKNNGSSSDSNDELQKDDKSTSVDSDSLDDKKTYERIGDKSVSDSDSDNEDKTYLYV